MPEWITLPRLTSYEVALNLMQQRVDDVILNAKDEAIFLLQHKDVYTAGTSYKEEELLNPANIPVIYTGRGGKFTYHGAGQRVIYPVLNLGSANRSKDIKLYVHNLENWIINTLSKLGINAYTIDDQVGIWVDKNNVPAKIASIGIRVRKWVTYHGIAVNIDTDLSKYSGIIPCGINNSPVTSLSDIGVKIDMHDFDCVLKREFTKLF